jgi:mycothiol synthase
MGVYSESAFDRERDVDGALDLRRGWRAAAHADRYPTARRLRLLISSRLYEPERNARVWVDGQDADGRVVGFAMLNQRSEGNPSVGLTAMTLPEARERGIAAAQVGWALTRAGELAAELGTAVTLGMAIAEGDAPAVATLERFGFLRQPGQNVYMERVLEEPLPVPVAPAGYTIRPLDGAGELEAYTALYGFTPMARAYLLSLLADPRYAHLVAVAPDGTLAGFCECEVSAEEWEHTGERVGWIEYVGTREEHQRQGLGAALTLAGLWQLRGWGAQTARLVTMSANERARRVYTRLGFRITAWEDVYARMVLAAWRPALTSTHGEHHAT